MLENFCGQAADGGLCGWQYIGHIAERFMLHVVSGGSVVIGSVCGLAECMRRRWLWQMRPLSLVAFSVVVALLFIGQREAFDVAAGDDPIKSIIDGLSWATGMTLAVVGVYRAEPVILGAATDYRLWQQRRQQ